MRIETQIIPRGSTVADVCMPQLSHGNTVRQVVTGDETFVETDGVWTDNGDVALGITTADCAPICFDDGVRVGVAHVGWRGLANKLLPNMLEQFSVSSLQVHLGPHLHTFEVKQDHCYDQLQAAVGSEFFVQQDDGRIQFYFTQALLSVLPVEPQVDGRNTETDVSLPSYRHGRNDTRILTTVRF